MKADSAERGFSQSSKRSDEAVLRESCKVAAVP